MAGERKRRIMEHLSRSSNQPRELVLNDGNYQILKTAGSNDVGDRTLRIRDHLSRSTDQFMNVTTKERQSRILTHVQRSLGS
jgi:hypothetical protein